jgi:uncharacterized protein
VILFLDTSALVKLYVQETNSNIVEKAVAAASDVVVSQITLAEAVSAFHYRTLKNELSNAEETQIFKQLLEDWNTFDCVDVNEHVAKEAAVLVRSRGLRGADAVQLATAALVSRAQRFVQFLAFDEKLLEAAQGVVRVFE